MEEIIPDLRDWWMDFMMTHPLPWLLTVMDELLELKPFRVHVLSIFTIILTGFFYIAVLNSLVASYSDNDAKQSNDSFLFFHTIKALLLVKEVFNWYSMTLILLIDPLSPSSRVQGRISVQTGIELWDAKSR